MAADTRTMFHVTDATNADSIQSEGLKAGLKNLVFLTSSETEAREIGEIYDTVDEPVVFEAEVSERSLKPDPEPHGDLDSWAHSGDIPAYDVKRLN